MTATIFPAADRPDSEQKELRRFRRVLSCFEELPAIIDAAAAAMNIQGHTEFSDATNFSTDSLRLEIVGDTGLHLTIVDLPGLIPGADNEDDSAVVENLLTSYLEKSRTIILAVIQANNDLDTATIIQRAKKFDKAGDRTVGIVTKPDLINEDTEGRIASLTRDKNKLKLGFFLLKNPSPMQLREGITWSQRVQLERQFFESGRWKKQDLDFARIGVENLRVFLQSLLEDHIERELPRVRRDAQVLLANVCSELKQLGVERASASQKRMYLTQLSMDFYNTCKAALDGNYFGTELSFFKMLEVRESNRLRAVVHLENQSFADYMKNHSEKRKTSSADWVDEDARVEDGQMMLTREEMNDWVKAVYQATRGRELPGNYNYVLLLELYHEQSARWGEIAQRHLERVASTVQTFVQTTLGHVVGDPEVRKKLQSTIEEKLETSTQKAQQELERLLADERIQPITYNHYYTDNIQKSRQDKSSNSIASAMTQVVAQDYHGRMHISNSQDEIGRLVLNLQRNVIVNMDQQACTEALDGLKSYYKVARKTFVDNVCRQVIERHLLNNLMRAFDPVSVSEYDDNEVDSITAETSQLQIRRRDLMRLREALEKSLRELRD